MKNRSFKKSVLLTCLVVVASLFFGMQPALGTDEVSTTTTRVQRVSVPPVMSYDGYLRDASGSPVPDGQYQFTFALFTEPEGGTAVWVEEHKNVRVRGGVFSVLLGRGTAAKPLDIPFDGSYFLGVRVGSDPEMVPRVELATAAYAFRARMADEVRDQSVTAEKLAPDLATSILGAQGALFGSGPRSPIKGANWHITGNLETDSTHNFIGTADSLPLIFRTSNREAMRITETGEFVIRGDLRVGRDLYVGRDAYIGRNLTVNPTGTPSFEVLRSGQVVITSTKTGTDAARGNYPLFIDGQDQGIAIKTKGTADGANNFISFWDDGGMVGRIEGNTAVDQLTNPEWILLTALAAADITISIINEIAAVTSANGCAGVGAVACPPIPSWNIEAPLEIALAITKEVATQVFLFTQLGVTYQSGSGDYAEWLKRTNLSEPIESCDIVGVFGGKVTKATEGAEQILVISHSPIVLGNMPQEGQEHEYEKVAFLGQVPVNVIGIVNEGDYIIPSGFEDGTGIAVSPELMTADEYARVVGRAWSGSRNPLVKRVNVAIGLNSGDVVNVIRKQQRELAQLRNELGRLAGLDERLARLEAALDMTQGEESAAGSDEDPDMLMAQHAAVEPAGERSKEGE